MRKLSETLLESLSLSEPTARIDFLIDKINEVISPPRAVSGENVNVRAMYIVNDQINSHGGRFKPADLLILRNLIIDTPVLIGHNHASEPRARNFHAELESKDGITWLKSYFYWPRTGESETDTFLEKIDSGVLKECSISFTYTYPECSECGQDIRTCPHEIGRSDYRSDNSTHFIYGGISEVLETSLVYKGSVRGTHLTDKLSDQRQDNITISTGNRTLTLKIDDIEQQDSLTRIIPVGEKSDSDSLILASPSDLRTAIARKSGSEYLLIKRLS